MRNGNESDVVAELSGPMSTYPPTKDGLNRYCDLHNLTSRRVAEIVEVNSSTVRHWMNPDKKLIIPFSAWFTLRTVIEGKPPR